MPGERFNIEFVEEKKEEDGEANNNIELSLRVDFGSFKLSWLFSDVTDIRDKLTNYSHVIRTQVNE